MRPMMAPFHDYQRLDQEKPDFKKTWAEQIYLITVISGEFAV